MDKILHIGKDSFTPEEFVRLTSLPGWLVEIQKTVSFWLSSESALRVQTSGSTGVPKEIQLSRDVLINSAKATLQFFELKPDSSMAMVLPANFIGGKMMVIRALVGGVNIHFLEPSSILNIEGEFDFTAMTPMQAGRSREFMLQCKKVLLGGAPVSQEMEHDLLQEHQSVWLGYGMTETASHIALRKLGEDYYSALPGVSFSVDNRSCLCIHAPEHQSPNLQTNDVVDLLTDHSFVWRGRADHAINTGGVKVFPEEVERKIDHLMNQHFFISSQPDNLLGERVILVVEGSEVQMPIFEMLSKFEQPRSIYFLDHFCYTDNGKLNRAKTMDMVKTNNF